MSLFCGEMSLFEKIAPRDIFVNITYFSINFNGTFVIFDGICRVSKDTMRILHPHPLRFTPFLPLLSLGSVGYLKSITNFLFSVRFLFGLSIFLIQ